MNWMIWFPVCLFLIGELLPTSQVKEVNSSKETKTKVVLVSQAVESPLAQHPVIQRPNCVAPLSPYREEMVESMLLGLGLGAGMVQKNFLLVLGLSLSLLMILLPTQPKAE